MAESFDITGRWDIISWEQLFDDGRRELPMGENLEGFIRYCADGDMVCMIGRADRPNFETGGQWNADDREKASAYNSMLAYAGRFTLEGDSVTHHVDISMFPNWKGGQQKRTFQLQEDGSLALTARLERDTPQARTAKLLWRRHIEQ